MIDLTAEGVTEELYKSIVDFVRRHQKASVSHIQRTYGFGYSRASKIMDKLEEDFVVSPMHPSGRRDVYPEIVAELKNEINQLKFDKDYAEQSATSWIDRAYKQRAKVELIKNEVEKFKVRGTNTDLDRFLDYLIGTAKFNHDEEYKDYVLVPKKPTARMMDVMCAAKFEHNTVGDIYNAMIKVVEKDIKSELEINND